MRIVDSVIREHFRIIGIGDVFRYGGYFHMKIEPFRLATAGGVMNAVNLQEGNVCSIGEETPVEPIDGRFMLERNC